MISQAFVILRRHDYKMRLKCILLIEKSTEGVDDGVADALQTIRLVFGRRLGGILGLLGLRPVVLVPPRHVGVCYKVKTRSSV